MDPSLLDEYSAIAAQAIFAAYPDWEAHASAQDGALVLEVPCPVAGHPELRIHTDDEEITVAYDRWHAHFDQWFETDEEHIFADAYACVRAILSEKIAVAVHMSGGRWAGSQILYAG